MSQTFSWNAKTDKLSSYAEARYYKKKYWRGISLEWGRREQWVK
jgi:hypothetical protein